jgi:hypothetical protein
MNELVSGYDFMKIADLCVDKKSNIERLGQSFNNVLLLDKPDKNVVNKLGSFKIIYVKIDYIEYFFRRFYVLLCDKVVIITHNGDYGITDKHIQLLNLPKIKRWFAQNTLIQHPKLVTIPIGIANLQYKHGNKRLLRQIGDLKLSKERLLYVNFNVRTNYRVRNPIMDLLIRKGYKTIGGVKPLDQELYWREIASSKFCVAPPGNGIDCHRIWECICLNTIPICINNIGYEQFKELPILFIDDWNVINDAFLESKWEEFSQKFFDTRMCYIDYWESEINSFL